MNYFIATDTSGDIIGLYTDDPAYAAPPTGSIPVSQSDADLLKTGFAQYQYLNGAVVLNQSLVLATAKATQIALIDSCYAAAEQVDIAYMSTTFQADDASQTLISKVLAALGGTSPAGFAWADKNNVAVAMTNAQLQGLANAILARNQPLFWHAQNQKATIRAGTTDTVAKVQAVVW